MPHVRTLIATLFVFSLAVSLQSGERLQKTAPETSVPNILVILADDLGYGDVGCYNSQSKVPTPHLDRLANYPQQQYSK